MAENDKVFTGSIPKFYDTLMVPLIFEVYAAHMAGLVAGFSPGAVLETAAGSGAVTRALAPRLGPVARYMVTDLNQPMLDHAAQRQGADARIEWRQADALSLPFGDASFDAVCCQFGAMFFPDRVAGYAEARPQHAPSARDVAIAYCQGTPLRNEIEARDPGALQRATDRAAEEVARRHGDGPVAGKIQAHVIVATH